MSDHQFDFGTSASINKKKLGVSHDQITAKIQGLDLSLNASSLKYYLKRVMFNV